MNLKLIKEYRREAALFKLSGKSGAFNEWWLKLTPEQQFESKIWRG